MKHFAIIAVILLSIALVPVTETEAETLNIFALQDEIYCSPNSTTRFVYYANYPSEYTLSISVIDVSGDVDDFDFNFQTFNNGDGPFVIDIENEGKIGNFVEFEVSLYDQYTKETSTLKCLLIITDELDYGFHLTRQENVAFNTTSDARVQIVIEGSEIENQVMMIDLEDDGTGFICWLEDTSGEWIGSETYISLGEGESKVIFLRVKSENGNTTSGNIHIKFIVANDFTCNQTLRYQVTDTGVQEYKEVVDPVPIISWALYIIVALFVIFLISMFFIKRHSVERKTKTPRENYVSEYSNIKDDVGKRRL